jgi:hypothetical protein
MTRNRLQLALFIVVAAACGAWALYNLRPLKELFGIGDFGGGAIFGLTTSVDAFQYLIAPLLAFGISRRVRNRAGFAQGLRRAHVTATLAIAGMIALFVVVTALGNFTHGVDGVWFVLLAAAFTGGALWLPLQTFFAASFVGILIIERQQRA